MNEANKSFLRCVDRLYSVASRVGSREVIIQVGTTLLIVRGSVPELASAWRQFAHLAKDHGKLINHLRYLFAVLRNMRGHDTVSLVELTADVSFVVELDVSVSASSVDMVA
jgi:hypothetical protein